MMSKLPCLLPPVAAPLVVGRVGDLHKLNKMCSQLLVVWRHLLVRQRDLGELGEDLGPEDMHESSRNVKRRASGIPRITRTNQHPLSTGLSKA